MAGDVREGFLCPVCLQDLGTVAQLQSHVSDAHRDSGDGPVDFFRDILGRAKQRLMSVDVSSLRADEDLREPSMRKISFQEVQELGVRRSHLAEFRRIRDGKVDGFAVQTNQLIIRLDKLISEAPSEPNKRKNFEKKVIPWMEDSSARMCEFCGRCFSLTRRKHHCRLCGRIMCHSCSNFLTFQVARKMTDPAFAAGYETENKEEKVSQASPAKRAERLLSATLSVIKRDGSDISLNSILNQVASLSSAGASSSSQEGEDHLRICGSCKGLLARREEQMDHRSQPPHLVQMYDRLRSLMDDASRIFPSLSRMLQSLNAGESMYTLDAAEDLKRKVLNVQEQIDFVSKKIACLGGEACPPRTLLLQRSIRSLAGGFLQEMILCIPALPTPDEYQRLQKECKTRLEERIQAERRAVETSEVQTKANDVWEEKQSESFLPSRAGSNAGWQPDSAAFTPVHYNPFLDEELIDPLQQQILIIKGYLKQAAQAGMLDEVKALEENVRLLESELKQRDAQTTPRSSVYLQ